MSGEISPTLRARLDSDAFARHLGAQILDVHPGFARVALDLEPHHQAMQGVTHGGVVFALADVALAVATHAYNRVHLALNLSINYHRATRPGERLIAEARERHRGGRICSYEIEVRDGEEGLVASLLAMVYRTREQLVEEDAPVP